MLDNIYDVIANGHSGSIITPSIALGSITLDPLIKKCNISSFQSRFFGWHINRKIATWINCLESRLSKFQMQN